MDKLEEFKKEVLENIDRLAKDEELHKITNDWLVRTLTDKYCYNFRWLGRPIIQYPQDIIAIQELIWEVKPDLIIETGIAHGGSIIFYASIMEMLGNASSEGRGHVLGIDIDIREHNRKEIESHAMYKRITMFEGSSIDDQMVSNVYDFAKDYETVLVILDASHAHEHVLSECRAYSKLVNKGSYLIVMDTVGEDTLDKISANLDIVQRPWGMGSNPKTAVYEFLEECDRFEVDQSIDNKLQISSAPSGYLKCIK